MAEELKGFVDITNLKELWLMLDLPYVSKNMYQVSNFGRVKNNKTGNILNGTIRHDGYKVVTIRWMNGEYHSMCIHRLVALTFVRGYDEFHKFVNHKNGIKTCNYAYNLEWVTCSENLKHSYKMGLSKIGSGENHPTSKLTNAEVEEICKELVKCGGVIKVVLKNIKAKGINANEENIASIKSKKCWTKISDRYFKHNDSSVSYKLTPEQVESICKLLILHNGNCKAVLFDLISDIPLITYNRIFRIKTKAKWKNISDKYFVYEDNKIKEL